MMLYKNNVPKDENACHNMRSNTSMATMTLSCVFEGHLDNGTMLSQPQYKLWPLLSFFSLHLNINSEYSQKQIHLPSGMNTVYSALNPELWPSSFDTNLNIKSAVSVRVKGFLDPCRLSVSWNEPLRSYLYHSNTSLVSLPFREKWVKWTRRVWLSGTMILHEHSCPSGYWPGKPGEWKTPLVSFRV